MQGDEIKRQPRAALPAPQPEPVAGARTAPTSPYAVDMSDPYWQRAMESSPPEPVAEDLVERLSQWLHDEVDYPDPHFPQHTWPAHPDDTGQRSGGWLKIIPKDTQEQFRDIARRLATWVPEFAVADKDSKLYIWKEHAAVLEAKLEKLREALIDARDDILELKNRRDSECEGTDADWVDYIDAALNTGESNAE